MIGGLVVAALIAVAIGLGAFGGGAPVEVAKVRKDSIREFVDERGKTRLPQVFAVTMPFEGRVAAIDLIEGTTVKQGQVVARIVPRDLQLTREAAEAAVQRLDASIKENDDASVEQVSLAQSLKIVESMQRTVQAADRQVEAGRAKLDYYNANLDRTKRLLATRAKSEDEFEQAQLAQVQARVEFQQDELVAAAISAVEAATVLAPSAITKYIARKSLGHDVLEKQKSEAEISLEQVKKNESRAAMTSPVDGVVLERLVSDERQVAPGTVLLKIGRLEELQVEAEVLSQDVVAVKPGDDVEITGPAIGATPARGTVDRVYPAGFTKVSSLGVEQQRVKVIIAFRPEDLNRLRTERGLGVDYRISVRIFTHSKEQALVVPRSALFRGAEGKWQVFAVRDGRARLQAVETGLMNDETVEILQGLAEGDVVVLAPETNLVDGARVRPALREVEQAASLSTSSSSD